MKWTLHRHTPVLTFARFLLKYINRDTVELLGRGSGGVAEARKVVESYEEKSPLYGVVHYRRKSIILKYVPEGTSRLLQGRDDPSDIAIDANVYTVRLVVQFQSILDSFTPYDTVFSFVDANELSESALGLSTFLQSSAVPRSKSSSSSSLRQQRLNEITEDSEEPQVTKAVEVARMISPIDFAPDPDNTHVDQSPSSATRAKALLAKRKQQREQELADMNHHLSASSTGTTQHIHTASLDRTSTPVRASSIVTDKDLPAPPPENLSMSPAKSTPADLRPSLDQSLPHLESDSDDDIRRPMPKQYPQIRYSAHLSAAESTSISKWSDDVLASTVKPKQKRATKGSSDIQARPKTSGNSDGGTQSLRANLPTTVRIPSRSSGQPSRPGSQQSTRSVPARFLPTQDFAPPMPSPSTLAGVRRGLPPARPNTSQGSSYAYEAPGMTPEKMRLMKALQMRKRNQLLTQRSNTAPPESTNFLANSTGSFQSTTSDLSIAISAPMLSEIPIQEPLFQAVELMTKRESQRTSPTSVITASDNRSTKPSSFSNDSLKDGSRTSLSSDTGSSTTPRAENDKTRQQDIEENKTTKSISHVLMEPVLASPIEVSVAPTEVKVEEKGKGYRPLTYHCTTADFLADIEEEDRNAPLPALKDGHTPSTSVSEARKSKKLPSLEPLVATGLQSANMSDESDDESFMEELQNATVHEAKPMSVNRTPATPVLSNGSVRTSTFDLSSEPPSADSDRGQVKIPMRSPSRSASNDSQVSPPELKRAVSRAGSTRSLSTALPQWPPPSAEPIPSLPKQRAIVGSVISKRVKTFEGLSQRDGANLLSPQKDSTPRSTSLSNMLKRASFLYSHSDGTSDRASPRTTPQPSPLRAEFENHEHESSPSRPWLQRPGTSTEVYSPTHKGETVSVTARIVRDPVKPLSAHGTSDTPRGLHMSPLIVEHETGSNLELRPPVPRELTTHSTDSLAASVSPSERRRFSFSSHKSGGQKLSPVENKSHRLSFTTHKKTPKTSTDGSPTAEDKKQSRTSRMLRRLSGLGKTRSLRDPNLSPTRDEPQPDIIEETVNIEMGTEAEDQTGLDPQSMRHVVDIGEVNVQFAETLLWKRRFLRVDDQGYLIFAPPVNDVSTRGKSRKIHLEELHRPCLPDHEREEMAWSIMLDLKSGGTVQCACENKKAQRSVLRSKSQVAPNSDTWLTSNQCSLMPITLTINCMAVECSDFWRWSYLCFMSLDARITIVRKYDGACLLFFW